MTEERIFISGSKLADGALNPARLCLDHRHHGKTVAGNGIVFTDLPCRKPVDLRMSCTVDAERLRKTGKDGCEIGAVDDQVFLLQRALVTTGSADADIGAVAMLDHVHVAAAAGRKRGL